MQIALKAQPGMVQIFRRDSISTSDWFPGEEYAVRDESTAVTRAMELNRGRKHPDDLFFVYDEAGKQLYAPRTACASA